MMKYKLIALLVIPLFLTACGPSSIGIGIGGGSGGIGVGAGIDFPIGKSEKKPEDTESQNKTSEQTEEDKTNEVNTKIR